MSESALSDVRVLDLTHHVAGPFCTKLLAHLGADVIKIERPGQGDPSRRMGPFYNDEPDLETSGAFLYLNAGKKSITLNLKTDTGVKIFKELVEDADVVVESFRPGVMSHLGLAYETLEAINPELIMTSISSFGQNGPYRDFKATGLILDAVGGLALMRSDGIEGHKPIHIGGSIIEYIGGIPAFTGTITALWCRDMTGQGQYIDVSCMESVVTCGEVMLVQYPWQGVIPGRIPPIGEMGFHPCKDGHEMVLAIIGWWNDLANYIDRPELKDEKFSTQAGRFIFTSELRAIIADAFAKRGKYELFTSAQERRLPFGYAATTEDLLNDPQHKTRGYFEEIVHPKLGKLRYPGAPFKMSETPWQAGRPAPLLGQHNEEIYRELLDYSKEDLVKLRERDII